MMKFILTISMLLSFAFGQKSILGVAGSNAGCIGPSGISFCNKTTVFFGNSITRGRLPVDLGNQRWTSVFCSAKHSIEINNGIDGETMDMPCVAVFDKTTIPVYDPDVYAALFIALGENDIGLNINTSTYTPATFKVTYTAAVTYAISTRGWPPSSIILMNAYKPYSWNNYIGICSVSVIADGTRAAAYNDKISEVASENGCIYVDIYSAMIGLGASYFNVDQLHPNAAGDEIIANYLINNL